MLTNKISSFASNVNRRIGNAILNNKPEGAKLSKGLRKVNDFFQGQSYNPGDGAYYALMTGCVIAPRLLQAREPDEFREILTRDVTSVLTILFLMKALKSGMCSAAQKKSGIVLVKDNLQKNAGKFKRLMGCINPKGIVPLDSKEILSRYSRFDSKETFVKALKTVDKEGGSIAKMFSIEKQDGLVQDIKKRLPFFKTSDQTPLLDSAKKMFGDDFANKSNGELIKTVEKITQKDKKAFEGLEEMIGTKSVGIIDAPADAIKTGLLNNEDNAITQYARNIAAKFEWTSLGITAGFLGFGLPKINEKLTAKRHLGGGKNTNKLINAKEQNAASPASNKQVYQAIQGSEKAGQVFQKFI